MSDGLPVPAVNPDTAPYWEAASQDRLVMQRCGGCGKLRFYPRHLCPDCWSDATEWVEVSGHGRVHSYTVMQRAPSPAFMDRVPYVVALIDLEEGPRMMANIVGADALDVAIGDSVSVCFEERGGGFKVPQFQRVAG
jgi:uncharacterized OB-fold protein